MAGRGGGRSISRRTFAVLVGALVILGTAAVAALVVTGDDPGPLEDLERADRAGAAAQRATRALSENLDRIAENLAAGADLSGQGQEIHELTERQRGSLEDLAALLRGQLRSLRATAGELRATQQSSNQVARLGERQTALVKRAVDALRRLRDLARSAGETSTEIARQSVYGARLAEDAQRAFSEP
jgi:methyl-accepting chemotaxis protein